MLAELLACEDGVFVRRAYWVLLGREPDAGGLISYLDRLRAGASKQQILLELSASPEGRAKDPEGANSPAAGDISPQEQSTGSGLRSLWSARSWDELVANHGRAFLNCAYQTLLGRDADPDGSSYYQARLRAGASKVQVLCALRYSGEYRSRARLLLELRRALPAAPRAATPPNAVARPASGASAGGPVPALAEVLSSDDATLMHWLCSLALGTGEESQACRDALARLRDGWSPREVLRAIEKSPASRRRRALLRRLDREIIKFFLTRVPVLGRLAAAAFAIDGDSPLERRMRRIEYRVLGSSEEVHRAGELRAGPRVPGDTQAAEAAAIRAPGNRGTSADGESAAASAAAGGLRSLPAPVDWGDK